MSKVFVISDTHFGDGIDGIIGFENRPFKSSKEMDQVLIANWNSVVSDEDIVFHLGDVDWMLEDKQIKQILDSLNGHKVLIMGNHDRHRTIKAWMDLGFEKVYDVPIVYDGFIMMSHEPMYISNNSPYVNIFGHVHGNPAYRDVSGKSFCACVERINYTPIEMEFLKKEMTCYKGMSTKER